MPESLSRNMRVFLLLATVIIIGITIVLSLNKQPEITQETLQQEIYSIQQQLPISVDAYTELKSVEVEGMEIKYSFVVRDNPTQKSNLSVGDAAFAKQVEAAVKASACQNKNTRRYISNNVSLSYLYLNKDNNSIAEFKIPAGFCG